MGFCTLCHIIQDAFVSVGKNWNPGWQVVLAHLTQADYHLIISCVSFFFVWCVDMLYKKAVEKYQKYNKNSLCREEKNKREQTKTQKTKQKLLRQIALMGKNM